jgi:hypothetical protein
MLDNRLKFRAGKIARSHLPTYHRLTDNGRIILVPLVVDEKHLETGFGGQRCASPMTPDVYFGAVIKGPDTLMVPSGIGPHAQPRAVNALTHIVSVCWPKAILLLACFRPSYPACRRKFIPDERSWRISDWLPGGQTSADSDNSLKVRPQGQVEPPLLKNSSPVGRFRGTAGCAMPGPLVEIGLKSKGK